ncbi:transporter substrate-binding domain-containing protein [Eubacteriaceae bacterium ES2]|nr:transporter substrate-binding domain-containing protein [Eubacteriaceae bacterium ES2]
MKKRLVVISVILVIVLSLSGCGKQEQDVLRVGMDLRFYPFTGADESGNPVGIEVDIANALGEYLGEEVEIVNTEFSMLIPALQNDEIDIIIGSMSITDEREETVDFSNPYLYGKIVALVNKDFAQSHQITDETPVDTFFSYPDTRFIGINGSIAVSIPQSYGYEVKSVTADAVAEREVVTGMSDVLVGSYTLYGMNDTNKDSTVMYKNPIELSETGMAVKSGNTELLEKVNAFIDQMESSGLNAQLKTDWDQAIRDKLFDDTMSLDYYLYKN